ncbi:MAG: nucleotidyltransferase family protein [Luteimonas sp.]
MLPPLRTVKAGLHDATEALALELARPGTPTPDWDGVQWRLASAAAAAHGVPAMLRGRCQWRYAPWQRFLRDQHAHVQSRQRRIAATLARIDAGTADAGIPVVALKGAALRAIGLYAPGERPMADIDLLVAEAGAPAVASVLQAMGYVESYAQWKHRVFKPAAGRPMPGLGEHCDTPVSIELHVRVQERLPVAAVDITARIFPDDARAGLNGYASTGALMAHLLLHAAGGICSRSLRLMHLHDIALLAARMDDADWRALSGEADGEPAWWAAPVLRLVARYYPGAGPAAAAAPLSRHSPPLLRLLSRRQTMTAVSCSELWLHPLAGLEWSRTLAEAGRYLGHRIRPPQEAVQERADMLRTQLYLQGQTWPRMGHVRRVLNWLAKPVPRMDMLYAVRAAMDSPVLAP